MLPPLAALSLAAAPAPLPVADRHERGPILPSPWSEGTPAPAGAEATR